MAATVAGTTSPTTITPTHSNVTAIIINTTAYSGNIRRGLRVGLRRPFSVRALRVKPALLSRLMLLHGEVQQNSFEFTAAEKADRAAFHLGNGDFIYLRYQVSRAISHVVHRLRCL